MSHDQVDLLFSTLGAFFAAVSGVAAYMQARIGFDMWRAQHLAGAAQPGPKPRARYQWGVAALALAAAAVVAWTFLRGW